jgi:hypothetical protein
MQRRSTNVEMLGSGLTLKFAQTKDDMDDGQIANYGAVFNSMNTGGADLDKALELLTRSKNI